MEEESCESEGIGKAQAQTEMLDWQGAWSQISPPTREYWGTVLEDFKMEPEMQLGRRWQASEVFKTMGFAIGKKKN